MNPLVSYCVKCYNQERYIAKALEAAFAQTYEPLEIVIGDDASTDRSDEIIRTLIAEYQSRGGKHQVYYFRNDHNLGNMGNWQHIVEQTHGELLIKADGDDWSEPSRTEKLVKVWIGTGKRVHCVYSDCWAVDKHGRKLWPLDLSRGGIGAVEAYSRDCFTKFPPLDPALIAEEYDDVVYSERARILCEDRVHIPEKLVHYRQGSGVSSFGTPYTRMLVNQSKARIACAKQLLLDLEHTSCAEPRVAALRQKFESWIERYEVQHRLCAGRTFAERHAAYHEASAAKLLPGVIMKCMLLPPSLRNFPIDASLATYRCVKGLYKRQASHVH